MSERFHGSPAQSELEFHDGVYMFFWFHGLLPHEATNEECSAAGVFHTCC